MPLQSCLRDIIGGIISSIMDSVAIWIPDPSPGFTHSGLLWQAITPYSYHYATEGVDLSKDPGFQRANH